MDTTEALAWSVAILGNTLALVALAQFIRVWIARNFRVRRIGGLIHWRIGSYLGGSFYRPTSRWSRI